MVLPPSMQGSLPAGWLAFTGRELNPLDRDEGFQITSSSSLPGLFLAQHPKTFAEAVARETHRGSEFEVSSIYVRTKESDARAPTSRSFLL
jgi:hypothetical protein